MNRQISKTWRVKSFQAPWDECQKILEQLEREHEVGIMGVDKLEHDLFKVIFRIRRKYGKNI